MIGDDPKGVAGRELCETLDFTYHGEWTTDASGPGVSQSQLLRPALPLLGGGRAPKAACAGSRGQGAR